MNRFYFFLLLACSFSSCFTLHKSNGGGQVNDVTRTINPKDVALAPGYQIEVVASDLTFPSALTFDDAGNLYAIETGYSYGEVFLEPHLIKIGTDGATQVIATGSKNGPWTDVIYHNGYFYIAEGGELEGGRILKVSQQGEITVLVDSLPSMGDHHTGGLALGSDGYLYFGQGTATNSAVVGVDNYNFGWLKRFPDFHDTPCADITLNGKNFTSDNPLTPDKKDQTTTGAYVSFGTQTIDGQVIAGKLPCNGAVMRVPINGGSLELVAWGFRNPYGLSFATDGTLYVSENGYDVRGSRPVWGSGDYLWKIEPGKWYGWPDFMGGHSLKHNQVPQQKDPEPLLKNYPNEPPEPAAKLGVHSSSNGMDFSRNPDFGFEGQLFIAQFGDMAPNVGKVLAPVGFRVVRVDVKTGIVTEFAANYGKKNGPATWLKSGGLERPLSVKFSPDGTALYLVDFGIMNVTDQGAKPIINTGVIWKITKTNDVIGNRD